MEHDDMIAIANEIDAAAVALRHASREGIGAGLGLEVGLAAAADAMAEVRRIVARAAALKEDDVDD